MMTALPSRDRKGAVHFSLPLTDLRREFRPMLRGVRHGAPESIMMRADAFPCNRSVEDTVGGAGPLDGGVRPTSAILIAFGGAPRHDQSLAVAALKITARKDVVCGNEAADTAVTATGRCSE